MKIIATAKGVKNMPGARGKGKKGARAKATAKGSDGRRG